jgi:hypothetical protein
VQTLSHLVQELLIRPGMEAADRDFFLSGLVFPTHEKGFAFQAKGGFANGNKSGLESNPNGRARPVAVSQVVEERSLFLKNLPVSRGIGRGVTMFVKDLQGYRPDLAWGITAKLYRGERAGLRFIRGTTA